MTRIPSLLAAFGLTAGLTVAVAAPAHADDRRCTGTIRAVAIDDNVVVPAGATCTLVGTRIDGNVIVKRNAKLVARGVRVEGNIQAENHRRVEVLPRTVNRKVVRSVIDGSIQLKQGGGGEVRRTRTNGDIQLFSNTRGGRFEVFNNIVDGNLQCKSNSPKPVGKGNRVNGNKEGQCRGF